MTSAGSVRKLTEKCTGLLPKDALLSLGYPFDSCQTFRSCEQNTKAKGLHQMVCRIMVKMAGMNPDTSLLDSCGKKGNQDSTSHDKKGGCVCSRVFANTRNQ